MEPVAPEIQKSWIHSNCIKMKALFSKINNKNVYYMRGGELPFLCEKSHCTKPRIDIINMCIPLYSTFFFDGNIVDNSGKYFIHYKGNSFKTYKLLDSLLLEEINFHINDFETYDAVTLDIDDYFQKSLTKNNIPCVYLFLKHADVFNIALSSPKKIYDDIFRHTNNIFIGFSASFNIFNLSLFTHTFFDILDLFDECFTLLNTGPKKIDTNFVANNLKNIYKNKESLCKFYDLAVYKKEILTMTNKNNNRELFLNNKFGCADLSNNKSVDQQKKESLIVGYETHEYDNYNEKYDQIIQKLTQLFINIATELYAFSKMLNVSDYKYMFLFSVLSYRLKNKYIIGGLCFSIKKTLDQLQNYANKKNIFESKKEYIKYFKPQTNFPIIYEYIIVRYKNKTYGNCMENVIFQFLKLFFWNNGTYELEKVKNIIKSEYYGELYDFFFKIENERDSDFMQEWVKFIMFDGKNINYDLIQNDVEINSTKKNLFFALREIFTLDAIYTDDKMDVFFSNLLEIVNVTIEIVSSPDQDKLVLKFPNDQTFTIVLTHNKHASFNEAVEETSDSSLNIINHIDELDKTNIQTMYDNLVKNKYYSISLNQWILLQIVFSDALNISDVQKRYIEYITKKFNNEIILLLGSVTNDSIRNIRIEILTKLIKSNMFCPIAWKYVFEYIKFGIFWEPILEKDKYLDTWGLIDSEGYSVWSRAIQNIPLDTFWERIMTKDEYLDTWGALNDDGGTTWNHAVYGIKSDKFWEYIMTKDKYLDLWETPNDNGTAAWYGAAGNIKSAKFWEYIMTKDKYFNTWDKLGNNMTTTWHVATEKIKSDKFWEYIMTKDKYLDTWETTGRPGYTDYSVWRSAIRNIKLDTFWEYIMIKDKYFDKWGIKTKKKIHTLWHYGVVHIKSNKFWEYIMTKDKYLDTWGALNHENDTVWHLATERIKSNIFWEHIMTKDKYLCTWDMCNFENNTIWHTAVQTIKSDKFWEHIMTKDEYLDKWNLFNDYKYSVWDIAGNFLKSNVFWEHIAKNKKYQNYIKHMMGGFYKYKIEKYKLKEKNLLNNILNNKFIK